MRAKAARLQALVCIRFTRCNAFEDEEEHEIGPDCG
jgi:hypothetical protein